MSRYQHQIDFISRTQDILRKYELEKPCARDPRSPVPLTLAVQNSLTL